MRAFPDFSIRLIADECSDLDPMAQVMNKISESQGVIRSAEKDSFIAELQNRSFFLGRVFIIPPIGKFGKSEIQVKRRNADVEIIIKNIFITKLFYSLLPVIIVFAIINVSTSGEYLRVVGVFLLYLCMGHIYSIFPPPIEYRAIKKFFVLD